MLLGIPSLMVARRGTSSASSLLTGLQVYYKLEDTSDSSGNAQTLTNTNTVTFPAGKVNNGAHFVAASSQRLTRADSSFFQMGTGDFTVACWVKATAGETGRRNIGVYGAPIAGGAGYGIWRFDDAVQAQIVDASAHNVRIEKLTGVFDGTWHFAVATFARAGVVTLYVDNVSITTGDITTVTGSVNSTTGFKFASNADFDGDAYYNGDVDEYGLWSRVLTGAEITALWNGGAGVTYPFS